MLTGTVRPLFLTPPTTPMTGREATLYIGLREIAEGPDPAAAQQALRIIRAAGLAPPLPVVAEPAA